jgi:hypothetical protein
MTRHVLNNVLHAVHNRLEKLKAHREPMTSRQNCVLSLRSRPPSRSGKQLDGALRCSRALRYKHERLFDPNCCLQDCPCIPMRNNLAHFMSLASLDHIWSVLPRTMDDIIDFARDMGERYLWKTAFA